MLSAVYSRRERTRKKCVYLTILIWIELMIIRRLIQGHEDGVAWCDAAREGAKQSRAEQCGGVGQRYIDAEPPCTICKSVWRHDVTDAQIWMENLVYYMTCRQENPCLFVFNQEKFVRSCLRCFFVCLFAIGRWQMLLSCLGFKVIGDAPRGQNQYPSRLKIWSKLCAVVTFHDISSL